MIENVNGGAPATIGYGVGQVFTSNEAGALVSIAVKPKANQPSGITRTLSVHDGVGLTQPAMGSMVVDLPAVGATADWVVYDVSSLNIQFEASRSYTFRLGGGQWEGYILLFGGGAPTGDGWYMVTGMFGGLMDGEDLVFRVVTSSATVPALTTWGIVAAALTLAGVACWRVRGSWAAVRGFFRAATRG